MVLEPKVGPVNASGVKDASAAVERVGLSCPPRTPAPRTMLFSNPVKEKASLKQLSGCAYHGPPPTPLPPRTMMHKRRDKRPKNKEDAVIIRKNKKD